MDRKVLAFLFYIRNMKKIIYPLVVVCGFLVLVFAYGPPERQMIVSRKGKIYDRCMVGDEQRVGLMKIIDQEKPDILLLGNSMLGEGVADRELSEYLSAETLKVWSGGASSAWWYLVMKNILPRCRHKPRYVAIFFRDTFLTRPQYRVNGKYKSLIDHFATREEEVLDRLAYTGNSNWLQYYLKVYVPLFRDRDTLRARIDSTLKQAIGSFFDNAEVDDSIASVFAESKMNKDLLTARQLQEEALDDKIEFHPAESFLPHIIELAKEQEIELFFVRVKKLRDLEPGREPAELLSYMEKLEKYLADNEMRLVDFTQDRRIEKNFYASGDHLNRTNGRHHFTNFLADRIKAEILPAGSFAGRDNVAYATTRIGAD